MVSCSIWFSATSFWMGGGFESRCVGRVYGADGAVRLARHHPHRTYHSPGACTIEVTFMCSENLCVPDCACSSTCA